MNVGVNARILSAATLRGWNRYTLNLLNELPALGVHPILYSDQALHPTHLARLPAETFTVRIAPPMWYARWEQRWLPAQLQSDGVALFHTPFHFGMPFFSHCPRVLTLHDAIDQAERSEAPLGERLAVRSQLTNLYRWIARTRAHQIITVSEHARGELIEHCGLAPARLTVTPEAADSHFHAEISQRERERVRVKFALNSSYIWYVGGYESRKNVPFLLRAFAEAALRDVRLVLAGDCESERNALERLTHALQIDDQVRLVGTIEDKDLPGLYAEALCFVYPSRHEGFGLQLCEAMATGCPTLAARASSLPEVLGNGGETFTLHDTAELSELLRRVSNDTEYRDQLAARATARSTQYSWKRTAAATVAVYRKAMNRT